MARKRPAGALDAERGRPSRGAKVPLTGQEELPAKLLGLAAEWRLVYSMKDFFGDLVPCDLQCYNECAYHRAFVFDIVISALKEPWAVKAFSSQLPPNADRGGEGAPRSQARDIDKCRKAFVAMLAALDGATSATLSPEAKRERQQLSRQRGLRWLGLTVVSKHWGFLSEPPRGKAAARNGKVISFLGERFWLNSKPDKFCNVHAERSGIQTASWLS